MSDFSMPKDFPGLSSSVGSSGGGGGGEEQMTSEQSVADDLSQQCP